MTNVTETQLLIAMYRDDMPRTCALADAGHGSAIRSLIIRAIGDEVQDQAIAACARLRDRGSSWSAIRVIADSRMQRAKSVRATMILAKMHSAAASSEVAS